MPGLDRRKISQTDHESVLAHVKADIRSDFILAPHYNAVFSRSALPPRPSMLVRPTLWGIYFLSGTMCR